MTKFTNIAEALGNDGQVYFLRMNKADRALYVCRNSSVLTRETFDHAEAWEMFGTALANAKGNAVAAADILINAAKRAANELEAS